jgi:alcohol dehydrogenase
LTLEQQVCGFYRPNAPLIGVGYSKEAGPQAKALGATKALIVTDKGLAQLGVATKIKAQLVTALCLLVVFASTYFASRWIAMALTP